MPIAFIVNWFCAYIYNHREQREVRAVTYVSNVEELAKVKLSRYRLEKSVSYMSVTTIVL